MRAPLFQAMSDLISFISVVTRVCICLHLKRFLLLSSCLNFSSANERADAQSLIEGPAHSHSHLRNTQGFRHGGQITSDHQSFPEPKHFCVKTKPNITELFLNLTTSVLCHNLSNVTNVLWIMWSKVKSGTTNIDINKHLIYAFRSVKYYFIVLKCGTIQLIYSSRELGHIVQCA